MAVKKLRDLPREAWSLVTRQHGVVTRRQLLALGYGPQAIAHRMERGVLHPVWRGVYAVGRPDLTRHGTWLAAVLACGPHAVLSHESAAALWEMRVERTRAIHVSVPGGIVRRRRGIVVHRRSTLQGVDVTRQRGIPVTSPAATLIDLAVRLPDGQIERAINEADRLGLTDPDALRARLVGTAGRRGAPRLRRILDRRTFALTDSELERRFLPIARAAGLPLPETGRRVHGFKVDFYWPDLGLIVETDGLRYHRTPEQQTSDHRRDQVHAAADLVPLRFTHAQIAHDSPHVERTLAAVARRLRNRHS
jgi:very-short-patch-repair endonuclease